MGDGININHCENHQQSYNFGKKINKKGRQCGIIAVLQNWQQS